MLPRNTHSTSACVVYTSLLQGGFDYGGGASFGGFGGADPMGAFGGKRAHQQSQVSFLAPILIEPFLFIPHMFLLSQLLHSFLVVQSEFFRTREFVMAATRLRACSLLCISQELKVGSCREAPRGHHQEARAR
jgi:hypothetical protein